MNVLWAYWGIAQREQSSGYIGVCLNSVFPTFEKFEFEVPYCFIFWFRSLFCWTWTCWTGMIYHQATLVPHWQSFCQWFMSAFKVLNLVQKRGFLVFCSPKSIVREFSERSCTVFPQLAQWFMETDAVLVILYVWKSRRGTVANLMLGRKTNIAVPLSWPFWFTRQLKLMPLLLLQKACFPCLQGQ